MLVMLGIGLFMLGIGLNVQYALDDYGIVKSSLHTEVLAQSNSSGSTGGTSGGREKYVEFPQDCEVVESFECKIGLTLPDWLQWLGSCQVSFHYTKKFPGRRIECIYTGNEDNVCFSQACIKNGSGGSSTGGGSGSGS